MVTWREFSDAEPALAEAAQSAFDADRHAVLATVRKNGAPRISGVEPVFHGTRVWLFLMPGSVKAADLAGDPRCALHSATSERRCGRHDPAGAAALLADDAKISGRALPCRDAAATERFLRFLTAQRILPEQAAPVPLCLDIEEVATVRAGQDGVVIRSWKPGSPARTRLRH
jgi:hypothetical protein